MLKPVLFIVAIAAARAAANAASFPNYITEEEFAVARRNPIVAHNGTVLPLPKYEDSQAAHPRPGFGPRLWTNREVPYTLDPNFNAAQREEVARAIDAYHKDTCIRFVPKNAGHGSWVDILYDAGVCGVAHVCMNNGAQFAKFGGSCVNAGVMAHELGHTLCMGHEQTRRDRDKWIGFNTAICSPHGMDGPDFNRGLNKLYDYVSLEHYEGECYNGCFVPKQDGVTKCGSGGPLAVLDIEILNEMYGCGGCLGIRWMNPANGPLNGPVETGFDQVALYSCRHYHNGDIVPGKYNLATGECHVAHGGREHRYTTDIEVLCSPRKEGGPRNDDEEIRLRLEWVAPLVPGGGKPRAEEGAKEPLYILGGRTRERESLSVVRCDVNVGGRDVQLPGKHQASSGAYTSWGGAEIPCSSYVFFVCNS